MGVWVVGLAKNIAAHPCLAGARAELITLCNKDFGAWDISTDSISLGVTDT